MARKAAFSIFMIGGALVTLPTSAVASGRSPITPHSIDFASHRECLARLEMELAQDRDKLLPKQTAPNGDTREIGLETKGIVRLNRRTARYESTVWYAHGRFREDLGQVEVSHSFEMRIRTCEGPRMRIEGENGYTLSTFEPAAEPPQQP